MQPPQGSTPSSLPRVPDVCPCVVFVGGDECDLSLVVVEEDFVRSFLAVKLHTTFI